MSDPFFALIVEDSPTMRKLIVFALSRVPNLKLIEADDGIDALHRGDDAVGGSLARGADG